MIDIATNDYAYIDKKNVTFSGTDTLAFIVLPDTAPIVLGSLTTFSYSSYRAKKPVSTLGSILSAGTAKGGRIIAGTLVFTIINQSWVNELIDVVPWLRNKCEGVVYSDELPLFDIIIISANEYGKHVNMKILGINITDEAGVLSVNDAYTENTFSFIAREIRTFNDKKDITKEDMTYKSNKFFEKFTVNTFGGSGFYSKEFNRYTNSDTAFDDIKNVVTTLSANEFDKLCNSLISLGYKYDDMTNSNVKIYDDIFYTINNIYGATNVDIFSFINNVLPHIDTDFVTNNNEYYISNNINNKVYFYDSKNLDNRVFSYLASSSSEPVIYAYSKLENDDGTIVLYTNKGYVKEDDVINTDEYKNTKPIGSTNSPGITNMNIAVKVDGYFIDNDLKTIIYKKTYYEFLEEFVVRITSSHDIPVKCISNMYTGSNDVSSFILSGITDVSFINNLDRLEREKPKEATIIIKELDYNNFFTIDVVFDNYNTRSDEL